jgi:hypothetical protein
MDRHSLGAIPRALGRGPVRRRGGEVGDAIGQLDRPHLAPTRADPRQAVVELRGLGQRRILRQRRHPGGDLGAEARRDLGHRGRRILDDVVEERAGERQLGILERRDAVAPQHLGGDRHHVDEIRSLAAGHALSGVTVGGEREGGDVALRRPHDPSVPRRGAHRGATSAQATPRRSPWA